MNQSLKRISFVSLAVLAPILLVALTLAIPTLAEVGKPGPLEVAAPFSAHQNTRVSTPAALSATCHLSPTLEQFITCVYGMALETGSGLYVVPSNTVLSEWGSVVGQMLSGACDAIALPAGLSDNYTVTTFIDSGKSYCVLYEITDADNNGKVDKGWGTFIVNNSPARELSIQAPHIKSDLNTHTQAVGVFKGVGARSFVMAGAHRDTNTALSCVSTSYRIADPAHNRDHTFQRTMSETLTYYESRGVAFNAIQFHGMAAGSCAEHVYMSGGMNAMPGTDTKIMALKSNLALLYPSWSVSVPGSGSLCTLYATQNVQGRLLNGVAPDDVCTTAAITHTDRFIHIEQDPDYRVASLWNEIIKATFSRYVATSGIDAGNDCTNNNYPCATIQYAVDVASPNEEIRVSTGVYSDLSVRPRADLTTTGSVTQVVYISKTVTIRGGYTTTNWVTSYPLTQPTTLNPQVQGRGLYITGNISPTIENLSIMGGNAAGQGGSLATTTPVDSGGGLYVYSATLNLNNCSVISNAAVRGGGVYVYYGTANLNGNLVASNVVTATNNNGGGVYLNYSAGTLTGNRILSNTAASGSGGMHLVNATAALNGNWLISNAGQSGGALYVASSANATLTNNIVAENRGTQYGSGVYVLGIAQMAHNTFARNTGGDGAAVRLSSTGVATLTNTIVASQTAGLYVNAGGRANITVTLWGSGAWANVANTFGSGTIVSGTNLTGDPAFVNREGSGYHIGATSAARDQGVDAGVTTDVDSQARPSDGSFDIGADEFYNRSPTAVDDTAITPESTSVAIPVLGNDLDPDKDSLTLELVGTPITGTVTINGATVVYTPAASWNGTDVFTYTASDGQGGSSTATVTVTINDAPLFTSTPVTIATQGTGYTYAISATDPDLIYGDKLIITALVRPAWLTLAGTGNGTATLSGTPTNADVGEHAVTLRVQDMGGLTATQSFTVTVANVNDAPTFTSAPVTAATQDVAYTYAVTAADIDVGDVLTITASVKPAWLTLAGTGNGTATLSGTPTNAGVGEHVVTLQVQDTGGLTATQSFTVNVANVNDAPTFSSTPILTTTAGITYTYNIIADIDAGDRLTITASTIPGWLTLIDNGNGTAKLTGLASLAHLGTHSVSLQVRDTAGVTATQSFTITVEAYRIYLPLVSRN